MYTLIELKVNRNNNTYTNEGYVISKPDEDIKKHLNMMDIRPSMNGYSYKILRVVDALKIPHLVGKDYLK